MTRTQLVLATALLAACGGPPMRYGLQDRIRANAQVVPTPPLDPEALYDDSQGGGAAPIEGVGTVSAEAGGSATISVTTQGVGSQSLESSLVNGMTDFVVSRAKAEVIAFVVNEFGKDLCTADAKWDVASFFPNTCGLLVGRDDVSGLTMRQMGNVFRVALLKDLRRMLPIAVNATMRAAFPKRLNAHKLIALKLEEILEGVRGGENPLAMIVTVGPGFPCPHSAGCAFRAVAAVVKAEVTSASDVNVNWRTDDEAEQEDFFKQVREERLRAELARDPALAAWFAELKKADADAFLREIYKGVRQVNKAAEWDRSGRQVWKLVPPEVLEGTVGIFREAFRKVHAMAALGVLDGTAEASQEVEECTGVARAVLSLIEGLWRGDNPIALTISAAGIIPCHDEDDMGCGYRIVSLSVAAIVKTGQTWDDFKHQSAASSGGKIAGVTVTATALPEAPPSNLKVKDYVKNVDDRLRRLIEQSADKTLTRWYHKHLDDTALRSYYLRRLLMAVRATTSLLGELVAVPATDLDKRKALGIELVTTALSIWHEGLTAILPEGKQGRAIRIIEDIQAARSAMSANDVGAFMVSLYAVSEDACVPDPFPPAVRKYMPLIVDLLSAKSAQEVSGALEKYAEPIGAWKRKRASPFLASLTSFVGATGGLEKVTGAGGDTAAAAALFAPIGVDVSFHSWGFYFSVLDVGTLTATRFKDNKAEKPNATFMQVLSPGMFLRWSPFQSPFVMGVGGSVVPGLRGPEGDRRISLRLQAFLAVDVTILAF